MHSFHRPLAAACRRKNWFHQRAIVVLSFGLIWKGGLEPKKQPENASLLARQYTGHEGLS